MKELPDLEKRLVMLEVAVQDLEDRSLTDSVSYTHLTLPTSDLV